MPDSRPLSSLRAGQYDDPPAAHSGSSTPRTRRSRLHNALRATADMTASDLAEMGAAAHLPPTPRPFIAPILRRRQRSPASDSRDTADSSEESRRRRPKRRRLHRDLSPPAKQPIKYGHFGQVEPGGLKLDIISCDGGEHRDPRHPATYLGPQNLLRHDKSVYCSERTSCGIVLRHADDTPFCLDTLHIVGPEHGFTAPVRQGLVYVAMTLNDLSKHMDPPPHARLHAARDPPYRRRPSFSATPERISLADALRDPEVNAAFSGTDRDYASRADAVHDLSEESYYDDDYLGRIDAETHCDIPGAGLDNFVITADDGSLPVALLSDEEPGPEERSSQEVLDFREQRLRNMRRRLELDSWDREERWNLNPYRPSLNINDDDRDRGDGYGLRHLDAMMARSRVADSPHHDELDGDQDRSDRHRSLAGLSSTSYYPSADARAEIPEHYDDGLNDPNVTRAKFHIRRGRHKVAIKFDPPVSGRFVLLKLWANRTNVDVQSVIAKGFGGGRFFPAVDLR